jgi:hypothetical protein
MATLQATATLTGDVAMRQRVDVDTRSPPERGEGVREEVQERARLGAEFDSMRDTALAQQRGDVPILRALGGMTFEGWCEAALQDIREGAALAYHCDAFARQTEDQGRADGPGPGGDWMDICGEPGKAAKDAASTLIERIGMAQMLREWNARLERGHRKEPEAEDFGHSMEAMGHGVAWSDDQPSVAFDVPHVDCIHYDIDRP